MNTLRKSLALAALLATFAAQAQAPAGGGQPPMQMPMHGASGMRGPMMDPARMQQRHEQRLAALKQALQLTPAQEGAWTTYAAALQPPQMPAPADREAMAKLATPERVERMKAMHQQRHAEMDRRADATLAFYAALDPEQKQRFDAYTARQFTGHGGEGHGTHGAHHGHRAGAMHHNGHAR